MSIPKVSYKFPTRGGSLDFVPHPLSLWECVTALTIYSRAQSVVLVFLQFGIARMRKCHDSRGLLELLDYVEVLFCTKIMSRVTYIKRVHRLTFCSYNVMLSKMYTVLLD